MKITKRQLRQIIKEERALITRSAAVANARRAEGAYANTADVAAVRQAIANLRDNTALEVKADDPYQDQEDIDEIVDSVVTIVLADALDYEGLQAQYQALTRTLE